MNTLHVKYLLVGGGLASSAAAETIRQHDAQGSVLLVTQENNRPYHRPALSGEYMRRERARADLTTFPPGWMKEHDVELRTGRRVSYIDTSRACATLDNGQVVSFDHLLIATGAQARPLKIAGSDLPNIYSLRTLDDADRLHHAIDTALREGHRHPRGVGRGRVAVIGGGLLATDLAASFTHLGLHVDLIVGNAFPWARWAGETKDFRHAMEKVEGMLRERDAFNPDQRKAHFVSVLAVAWPDGHVREFEGRVDGTLVWPPRGDRGFGYDPMFVPVGYEQTFGELDPELKHSISHRADAFRKLVMALKE